MSTDVLMNMSVPAGSTTGAGLGNLGAFGSIGPVTGMNMGNLAFNGFMMGPSHSQSFDSESWVDLLVSVVQTNTLCSRQSYPWPPRDWFPHLRSIGDLLHSSTIPLLPDNFVASCLTPIGDSADIALQS